MRAGTIILMCILAAVVYGIVHDLVTAHVCVEYFTVGHPPVFATADPLLLAFGWGVIATWWVGLILGIGLAVAARMGSRPPRTVRSLARPVMTVMVVSAGCALVMGIAGFVLAEEGMVCLKGPMAIAIPAGKHSRFLVDLWAHSTSYAVGFVGGLVAMVRVWRSRKGAGPA
jgi:hypothetical protein